MDEFTQVKGGSSDPTDITKNSININFILKKMKSLMGHERNIFTQ